MNPNNKVILETSHRVMISGQCIFYRVACTQHSGAGTGSPPLVLLHGHGVSGAVWQCALPFLAQHHRVLIVDLPGHGRSKFTGTWRLREIAPLLVRWLREMELPPVVLVGHSMGGAIAIHLTASAPELIDRLVLVDAGGMPLRAPLSTLATRAVGSLFQPGSGALPPQVLRDHLLTPTRLLWGSALEMAKSDFRAELALISVPTLIIWGERDLLIPLALGQELHTALPHATFVTMPQSGHRPMLAQPATFSQIVLRFLQQS